MSREPDTTTELGWVRDAMVGWRQHDDAIRIRNQRGQAEEDSRRRPAIGGLGEDASELVASTERIQIRAMRTVGQRCCGILTGFAKPCDLDACYKNKPSRPCVSTRTVASTTPSAAPQITTARQVL